MDASNILLPAALRSGAAPYSAASASAESADASRALKANSVKAQLTAIPSSATAVKSEAMLAPVSQAELAEAQRLANDDKTRVTLKGTWMVGGDQSQLRTDPRTRAPTLDISTENKQLEWSYSRPELAAQLRAGKAILVAEKISVDLMGISPVSQTVTLAGLKAAPHEPGYVADEKQDINMRISAQEVYNNDGKLNGLVLAHRPFDSDAVLFLQQHGALLQTMDQTYMRSQAHGVTMLPYSHLVVKFHNVLAAEAGNHAAIVQKPLAGTTAGPMVQLPNADFDLALPKAKEYLSNNFLVVDPAKLKLVFTAGGMRDPAGKMVYTGFNNPAFPSYLEKGQFQHSGTVTIEARTVTLTADAQ